MELFIAEKPSVGKAIAAAIGATESKNGYMEGHGFMVTWCLGHLVELAMPEDYNKDYAEDFVPVRSRFLTVGGGIEVFPLKNDDIRLHAVYWTNSDATCSNFGHHFAFGITYRLRVIRNLPQ